MIDKLMLRPVAMSIKLAIFVVATSVAPLLTRSPAVAAESNSKVPAAAATIIPASGPTMSSAVRTVAQAPAAKPDAPTDIPSMALKVADFIPAVGFAQDMRRWFVDEIGKRTGGKVKFQVFWAEALLKAKDIPSGLGAGVAELGNAASTFDPARTPIWMTLDMPYNAKDYWCGLSASRVVADEEPGLREEFEKNGFKPIIGYASGHFHFLTKSPILKVSDLPGKRLRTYGGARVRWMQELGITPIFMPYGGIYEGVERGVLDGAEAVYYLSEASKHYEIAKNLTVANSGFVVGAPWSINLKVWNSFPESLKQIFREVGREHDLEFARKLMELEGNILKKWQEKDRVKVHHLSADDQKALEDAGKLAQKKWRCPADS
jgi:TRAP-type C4-dicarboxylate transport system substrate-binding protein